MKLINYFIDKLYLDIFLNSRILKIFLLGCISGYPWVLIGSSLTLWLKDDGLSRSSIGWAGLIFSVYALNFLWAPFVDKLKIPLLTNKIGQRKSWILILQSLIILFSYMLVFPKPKRKSYICNFNWFINSNLFSNSRYYIRRIKNRTS